MLLNSTKTVILAAFLIAGDFSIAPLKAAPIGPGSIYDVVDLGGWGGSSAAAKALNEDGATAGFATDIFDTRHAIAYGPDGSLLPLSVVGDAMATGINAGGQISGTQWVGGQAFATRWDADGSWSVLSGPGSYSNAINAGGQVTGMHTVDGEGRVFTASADGTVIDLGTMPGGNWSSGYGINAAGDIAGYGMGPTGFGAFSWSEDAGYQSLGGLGGTNSYAMGINDHGAVTGHAQTSAGYLRAVLWINGVASNLGTLGGNASYGYGVNNLGQVAGYSWTAAGQQHAFVYAGGLMLDLNDLIAPESGWVLREAYAINDAGQIAGTGTLHGVVRAFRLDLSELSETFPGTGGGEFTNEFGTGSAIHVAPVPEPGTWAMGLAGIGIIGYLGWQRQRTEARKQRVLVRHVSRQDRGTALPLQLVPHEEPDSDRLHLKAAERMLGALRSGPKRPELD